MLMKVVMAGKVCCHRPMLRLPVSTALKLRFGQSVAAQLLPLVINTTLLIAGAVQGCDSVLPALHTLTGSWALFLSMCLCLCLCTYTHTHRAVHTQQSQRRRAQFVPQGNWLLARWFCVMYCKSEEPRYNLCLSLQLQGCHGGFEDPGCKSVLSFILTKAHVMKGRCACAQIHHVL